MQGFGVSPHICCVTVRPQCCIDSKLGLMFSHRSEGNQIGLQVSMTKLTGHMTDHETNHMLNHVMYLRVLGHVTDHVTGFESQSLNRQVDFHMV